MHLKSAKKSAAGAPARGGAERGATPHPGSPWLPGALGSHGVEYVGPTRIYTYWTLVLNTYGVGGQVSLQQTKKIANKPSPTAGTSSVAGAMYVHIQILNV